MTDEEKQAYRTSWEFRCEPGCNVFEWGPPPTPGNGGEMNAGNSDSSPRYDLGKSQQPGSEPGLHGLYRALNSTASYYDFLTKEEN